MIGTICYCVMVCISIFMPMDSLLINLQISVGEMIAFLPIPGGHIKLAERFVDPALSFTMGWNYWYVGQCSFLPIYLDGP
jgi:amino acid transporter